MAWELQVAHRIWNRLVPGRLMVKFYLWFLLALTLTIAGTAGVQALLSLGEFEGWAHQRILDEVRMGRDLAERLLSEVSDPEVVRSVLTPLTAHGRLAVAVVGADGRRVLELTPPGAPSGEQFGAALEEARAALVHGSWVDLDHSGRMAAALPITLPGGETGLFFVSVNWHTWRGEGTHTRLIAGLGAVLVLGWVLCWPLAAWLTRPLTRMAAAADALGAGDLSVRIGLNRRDEIGRLARSFDTMAASVQRLLASHKQLLADISHEFRTPLSRLRVALELARGEERQGAAAYLDVVEKQTGAIDGMIEELLTYSRLDSAPYQLHARPVRMAELIEDVMADLRPDAEAAGIALETEIATAATEITADATLLMRALGNVVRNAIAHAPTQSIVRLGVSAAGGRLTFTVSDEGPGVAPEMLERIFEPFVRTSAARTRDNGGVGLGLAIARRCMQAHGGGAIAQPRAMTQPEAIAQPEAGPRGLTVKLWLPLEEA